MKKLYVPLLFGLILINYSCDDNSKDNAETEWPEITAETRPWTRWWWHDSAVTPEGLTENMETLNEAGFGGLEITPIYGVKGHENEAIKFESDEWMKVFEYTLREGKRLNLGIDLANASGWPFGGPWVGADNACKNIQYKIYRLDEGSRLSDKIGYIQKPLVRAVGHYVDISEVKFPVSSNTNLRELAIDQVRFEKPLPLVALMAFNDKNEVLDLTGKVADDRTLDWEAPAGKWVLYALFQGWHGKMVERAGHGGEGNVIDHFSEEATREFLKYFDEHAKDIDLTGLRAFFNDSYEVDDASGQADWTHDFFNEFESRRGYDLKEYLPALFGNDSDELNSRVLCDYRETISDLLLDNFTRVWAGWAWSHNAIIRNQAHGSPANILDLYAASDIPETEGTNPMRIKMATSASHVSGKLLVSCEAATWLDEHFRANLGDVRQNLDRFMANGVNHIVYHGTPYSPREEEWPGRMFYAAVHFAPTNSLWPDIKALNDYIANCQSFMQSSTPDNDILLYFPVYDAWSEKGNEMLRHFGGEREALTQKISEFLLNNGYTFDYISDRQILTLEYERNLIKAPGATYKTILIPTCRFIPLKVMQKLMRLAQKGATILFQGGLPEGVPGLNDLGNRQREYNELLSQAKFEEEENNMMAITGKGRLLAGDDIEAMLLKAGVFPEELARSGLWFNRVERPCGTCYFISNWSENIVDQWITVQESGASAVWFNPMSRERGKAKIKTNGKNQSEVYIKLNRGESMILQFYHNAIDLEEYPVWSDAGERIPVKGEWTVTFEDGGPTIPESYRTTELDSWTEQSDESREFSGSANYTIIFTKPGQNAKAYILDLGEVHESAAVYLNGQKLGTLLGPSYQLVIYADSLQQNNVLEIRVSNLMANRIIYMDKNGLNYRKFYNINFAAHDWKNAGSDGLFTAARWEPFSSGLLGPVTLKRVSDL